jgi:hypothetical protein
MYEGTKETAKESGGLKYDGEKLRVDLVDPLFTEAVAKGLTYGAEKYGEHNWMEGIQFSRVYGALLRHLMAWYKGEEMDEESGNHHFDHAGCMLMMLNRYTKDERYKHLDDRGFKEDGENDEEVAKVDEKNYTCGGVVPRACCTVDPEAECI